MKPVKKRGKLFILSLCLLWVSASAEPLSGDGSSGPSGNVEAVLARLEEKASLVQTLKANFIQEKNLAVLDHDSAFDDDGSHVGGFGGVDEKGEGVGGGVLRLLVKAVRCHDDQVGPLPYLQRANLVLHIQGSCSLDGRHS